MAILKHADFEVPGFGEFAAPPVAVPSYAQAINALSPLAYWRLGEASGAALADQAGAHPLSLSGNYTLGQAGALDADADSAVFFQDGVAASTGAVLPTGASDAFSLLFWVRVPGPIPQGGPIIGQFVGATTGGVRLILLADGRVQYLLSGDPELRSSPVVDTAWRMLVLTRASAGTASWFVDGSLDVQGTGHGTAVDDTIFRLGASTASYVDVLLDEVAVLDRDLSAEEVRWLHGLGRASLALPLTE